MTLTIFSLFFMFSQVYSSPTDIFIYFAHYIDSYMKQNDNNKKHYDIYPGTKWCGPGNISENENDLGIYSDTDSCCRDHDMCDDYILRGSEKYGLINNSSFTRVSCSCDYRFYDCLKHNVQGSNSKSSATVGYIYFTLLDAQCFSKEYPISRCSTLNGNRCVKYDFDTTKDMIYQWFDDPLF